MVQQVMGVSLGHVQALGVAGWYQAEPVTGETTPVVGGVFEDLGNGALAQVVRRADISADLSPIDPDMDGLAELTGPARVETAVFMDRLGEVGYIGHQTGSGPGPAANRVQAYLGVDVAAVPGLARQLGLLRSVGLPPGQTAVAGSVPGPAAGPVVVEPGGPVVGRDLGPGVGL